MRFAFPAAHPNPYESSLQGRLPVGLKLRQKQDLPDVDFLGIERLDDSRNKLRQSGAGGDVRGQLADLRADFVRYSIAALPNSKAHKGVPSENGQWCLAKDDLGCGVA
jgi:hypothetical protein